MALTKLTTSSITGDTLAAGDIAADAITASELADNAVDTAAVADDAITADKLANSINTAIAANTAKTTNATHSGEVTGSGALTVADNIIDEANLKVSNSPTNGYMLTAQSGNTGGLTWAEAPSGTFVKVGDIRSNSAASSHSLTGIFSDTYDKYFFSLSTFPSVSNNAIQFRFLDGSNNDISTGYYGASWGRNQSNSNPSHAHNGHDNIALSNGHSNGRAFQCQGYIIGPTSGIGSNKQVMWHANQWDNVNVFETQVGGYTNVSATDYTGMKIKSNSDNLTAISLQVYGIVDTKHYNGS